MEFRRLWTISRRYRGTRKLRFLLLPTEVTRQIQCMFIYQIIRIYRHILLSWYLNMCFYLRMLQKQQQKINIKKTLSFMSAAFQMYISYVILSILNETYFSRKIKVFSQSALSKNQIVIYSLTFISVFSFLNLYSQLSTSINSLLSNDKIF